MKTTTRNETAKQRLEYLRGVIRTARVSYDELHELQSLASHIAPWDVELLEAAGVPEFPETAKHTPGPWKIDDAKDLPLSVIQDTEHGPGICEIGNANTVRGDGPNSDFEAEQWANARLIAAAPELLQLAQHLAENPYLLTPDQWASEARAAIARATGGEI